MQFHFVLRTLTHGSQRLVGPSGQWILEASGSPRGIDNQIMDHSTKQWSEYHPRKIVKNFNMIRYISAKFSACKIRHPHSPTKLSHLVCISHMITPGRDEWTATPFATINITLRCIALHYIESGDRSVVTRWTVDQEVVGSYPTHGGNLISVVRSLSGFTQPIR